MTQRRTGISVRLQENKEDKTSRRCCFLPSQQTLLLPTSLPPYIALHIMASIAVTGGATPTFTLGAKSLSYILRVDTDGELVGVHFGAATGVTDSEVVPDLGGWQREQRRREIPTAGRGDLRVPGVHISHSGAGGHTVSRFTYVSHSVVNGKPALSGQPHTFAGDEEDDVQTLHVEVEDKASNVAATLSYSVFARGAIARNVTLKNNGSADITLERVASLALDLPSGDLEMVHHYGSWAHEFGHVRRKVVHGTQG
jgi:alpha-galactosidase